MQELVRWQLLDEKGREQPALYDALATAIGNAKAKGLAGKPHAVSANIFQCVEAELVWTPDNSREWGEWIMTLELGAAEMISRRRAKVAAVAGSPTGMALRSLQQLDQVANLGEYREILVEAEDRLGVALDLACTGEKEGPHLYSHGSGTCPVHEWLVEADEKACRARTELKASR